MGATEFRALDPAPGRGLEKLRPLVSALASQPAPALIGHPTIFAVYASEDHWAPEVQAERLERMWTEEASRSNASESALQFFHIPALRHAFVLNVSQSLHVAELVAHRLASAE